VETRQAASVFDGSTRKKRERRKGTSFSAEAEERKKGRKYWDQRKEEGKIFLLHER